MKDAAATSVTLENWYILGGFKPSNKIESLKQKHKANSSSSESSLFRDSYKRTQIESK